MKLDMFDRKILSQLDVDCRQSDAKIGKKVRLSKQVVNYRIKRLADDGIITSFFPHINTARLGFAIHKVYVRFKAIQKEKEEELWKYLTGNVHVIWAVSCSGRWDVIFAIASRTIEEFNAHLSGFMDKFSAYISERAISVFNKATLHNREWLAKGLRAAWMLGGQIFETQIDDLDRKILGRLAVNARMPLIDIAKGTSRSSSLILLRIRKLQELGIVCAFRAGLSRKKLDVQYCKAFLYYQNKTDKDEKKLLSYCASLPWTSGISQSIGPWDLEIEFEVKSYENFHMLMKEMRNAFPIVANFETAYIEKEHGFSYLPPLYL